MKIIVKTPEKLIKYIIHNVQGLSFGQTQKLLRKGDIKVNGKRTKENIDLKCNDEIDIFMPAKIMPTVPIIFEDENILIVNKPAGLECASRDKSSENTYSLEEIFADKNAIVVHRLDRLTEGLVILAKNKDIAREFEKIFKTKQIKKYYMAGVWGNCTLQGVYKAFLIKDSKKSIVHISHASSENSKEIITEFKPIYTTNNCTTLNVLLHTGRTHQIRAHLNYLGFPIINDSKYGKEKTHTVHEYSGYFLTSYKLQFDIHGKMDYLNAYTFEISPSWQKYISKKDV